jgi:zinc protease
MLFKGTRKYGKGEIDLLTMKSGGSNNAFTSFDFTAYYFSFAADRWQQAVEIEADRMNNTLFDPVEFEAERRVVLEELKGRLDQPWGLLMQELYRTALERHPYRNPVIGWIEDVESATLEEMEGYYRLHYCPSNATLVVVGDFETGAALEKIHTEFGHLPPGHPPPARCAAELPQTAERRFQRVWRGDVPRIAIAYPAPRIGHPDSYALQVLASILSDGKASRLYQRLVETDRAATFASAEYGEALDDTLFSIRAEGRGSLSAGEIEALIHDEIEKLASSGVTPHELDRARNQIESHFVFSMERSLDQAMLLGQIRTLTTLDYIDAYVQRIRTVDPAEVQAACRRYLTPLRRTVGWLLEGSGGSLQETRA